MSKNRYTNLIIPKSVSNKTLYLVLIICSIVVITSLYSLERLLDYRFAQEAKEFKETIPSRAIHESYSQTIIDNGIPITKYNSDLGNIPNDEINLIYQDSLGIIWVGTDFGLCYHNGKEFKPIEVIQSFEGYIPGARPTAILGDSKGRLFIYFNQIGLCQYDFKTKQMRLLFHQLPHARRLQRTDLFLINNNLYFSNDWANGTVYMVDLSTYNVYELEHKITGMFVKGRNDKSVSYYSFDYEKYLTRYLELIDTILIKDVYLPDMPIEFIHYLNKDSVVMFSKDVKYFYIHNRQEDSITINAMPMYAGINGKGIGSILNSVYDHRNSDFIFSGWGGVCIFNHRTMKYTNYHNKPSPNNSFSHFDTPVTSSIIDNVGNIWIGSYFSGITKLEVANATFQNYSITEEHGTKIEIINDIIETNEGELLLATKNGLMITDTNFTNFNLLTDTFTGYAGCNKNWFTNILDFDENKYVINSWGGYPITLLKNRNEWHLKRSDFRRNTTAACGIFCNQSLILGDKIFYGSWGMGNCPLVLSNMQVDTIWFYTQDFESKSVGSSTLLSTFHLDSNYLWLGYSDKGIELYEVPNGILKSYTNQDTIYLDMHFIELEKEDNINNIINNAYITQFIKLSNGLFFALSTSGLFSIEDKIIKQHSINGLGRKQIKVIKENPYTGDVWVGTTNGLYLVSPDLKHIIKRYDTRYGLNTASITGIYFTSNGRMLVTTKQGISMLRDRNIVKDQPVVLVNNLYNSGSLVVPIDGLYRFHRPNQLLRIDCFTNLNLNDSKSTIRFKVPGMIPDWTVTDSGSDIYFSLNAGRHKILLQAASLNGNWTNPINTLFVIVPCPWYASTWFKSLILLIIGLLIFIYYNEKISQRRKEQEMKEVVQYLRLQTIHAQMNPHFIFNMLGTVQYYILKKDPMQANKLILKLSRLIRNYLDSSVKSSHAEPGISRLENTLRQELELIKDYMDFEMIQANNNFDFDIYIDPNIDLDMTTVPPMLLQPFLENSVKHGVSYLDKGGLIKLNIQAEGENLRFIIKDNGVGRSESKKRQEESLRSYKSYGTELVMKKVEMLREMGYFIELYTRDLEQGFEVTILIQQ